MDQSIQIAVRIKPCLRSLISSKCEWDEHTIRIGDKNTFNLDFVLDQTVAQQEVFKTIGLKLISNVMEGYNACLFAYGQTGSGKTFTMTGTPFQQGVIQKSLNTLWNLLRMKDYSEIKLSYFQIYNQTIKDLINQNQNLIVRQHQKIGFYVQNLSQHIIQDYDDFERYIKHGISVRTVKQTKMNQLSSRSHSVLVINVCYKNISSAGLESIRRSKITFIDLAGSEKQKQAQTQGLRLKQAANINKSLSTLSLVIGKLSESSQKKQGSSNNISHIPYRNSVLTKILKNSLSGKSKIIIICTVSLEDRFIDETLSTLRFAQTAKSIKLNAKKNEEQIDGSKDQLLMQFTKIKQQNNFLKDKIQWLQKQLEQFRLNNAKLLDQIQIKDSQLSELQINAACEKIGTQQLIQTIKSQVASQQYYVPTFSQQYRQNFHLQNNIMNERDSLYQEKQNKFLNQVNFVQNNPFIHSSQQFSNSSNDFFQPQLQYSNFYSSQNQFLTPRKKYFTIQQADEKQEIDFSQIKQQLLSKIKKLQKQVDRLLIQNQFLIFQKDMKENQIKHLLKENVFINQSEEKIQQDQKAFKLLVQNKDFSAAQKKFLRMCSQKCNQEKLARQTTQQAKKEQKQKLNQIIAKIRNLLHSFVQSNIAHTNPNTLSSEFIKARNELFIKSSYKKQNQQQNSSFSYEVSSKDKDRQNANTNFQMVSGIQKCRIEQKSQKNELIQQIVQKQYHSKSFNKSVQSTNKLSPLKGKLTPPVNFQSLNNISQSLNIYAQQRNILPQNRNMFSQNPQMQSLYQLSQINSQQQQLFGYNTDNHSIQSQGITTNKFSNNQLEYIKKDYQKLQLRQKNNQNQIQRLKILQSEKQSLIFDKQNLISQLRVDLQDINKIIQNKQYLIECQKQKYRQMYSKCHDYQRECVSLKQYLQDINRKHDFQMNEHRLKIKSLEFQKKNIIEKAQAMNQERINEMISKNNYYQKQIEEYHKEKYQLQNKMKQIIDENNSLQNQYAVLNAENRIMNEKIIELKSAISNSNLIKAPAKFVTKNGSFYSISQQKSQTQLQPKDYYKSKASSQVGNNFQINTIPQQISQKQLAKIIQQKNQQRIHIAAHTYYNKYQILKQQIQIKQQQLESFQNKFQQIYLEISKYKHKFQQQNKQHLHYKGLYLENRQKQFQLKERFQHLAKINQNLRRKLDERERRIQILENKLKKKQQKQFESRQKYNNMTSSSQVQDSRYNRKNSQQYSNKPGYNSTNIIKSPQPNKHSNFMFSNRRVTQYSSSLSSEEGSNRSSNNHYNHSKKQLSRSQNIDQNSFGSKNHETMMKPFQYIEENFNKQAFYSNSKSKLPPPPSIQEQKTISSTVTNQNLLQTYNRMRNSRHSIYGRIQTQKQNNDISQEENNQSSTNWRQQEQFKQLRNSRTPSMKSNSYSLKFSSNSRPQGKYYGSKR